MRKIMGKSWSSKISLEKSWENHHDPDVIFEIFVFSAGTPLTKPTGKPTVVPLEKRVVF